MAAFSNHYRAVRQSSLGTWLRSRDFIVPFGDNRRNLRNADNSAPVSHLFLDSALGGVIDIGTDPSTHRTFLSYVAEELEGGATLCLSEQRTWPLFRFHGDSDFTALVPLEWDDHPVNPHNPSDLGWREWKAYFEEFTTQRGAVWVQAARDCYPEADQKMQRLLASLLGVTPPPEPRPVVLTEAQVCQFMAQPWKLERAQQNVLDRFLLVMCLNDTGKLAENTDPATREAFPWTWKQGLHVYMPNLVVTSLVAKQIAYWTATLMESLFGPRPKALGQWHRDVIDAQVYESNGTRMVGCTNCGPCAQCKAIAAAQKPKALQNVAFVAGKRGLERYDEGERESKRAAAAGCNASSTGRGGSWALLDDDGDNGGGEEEEDDNRTKPSKRDIPTSGASVRPLRAAGPLKTTFDYVPVAIRTGTKTAKARVSLCKRADCVGRRSWKRGVYRCFRVLWGYSGLYDEQCRTTCEDPDDGESSAPRRLRNVRGLGLSCATEDTPAPGSTTRGVRPFVAVDTRRQEMFSRRLEMLLTVTSIRFLHQECTLPAQGLPAHANAWLERELGAATAAVARARRKRGEDLDVKVPAYRELDEELRAAVRTQPRDAASVASTAASQGSDDDCLSVVTAASGSRSLAPRGPRPQAADPRTAGNSTKLTRQIDDILRACELVTLPTESAAKVVRIARRGFRLPCGFPILAFERFLYELKSISHPTYAQFKTVSNMLPDHTRKGRTRADYLMRGEAVTDSVLLRQVLEHIHRYPVRVPLGHVDLPSIEAHMPELLIDAGVGGGGGALFRVFHLFKRVRLADVVWVERRQQLRARVIGPFSEWCENAKGQHGCGNPDIIFIMAQEGLYQRCACPGTNTSSRHYDITCSTWRTRLNLQHGGMAITRGLQMALQDRASRLPANLRSSETVAAGNKNT